MLTGHGLLYWVGSLFVLAVFIYVLSATVTVIRNSVKGWDFGAWFMSGFRSTRAFLFYWQDLVGVLPVLGLALLASLFIFPRLVPGLNFEALAELPGANARLLIATVVAILASIIKSINFADPSDHDEKQLAAQVLQGNKGALYLLILDRLTWFAIFILISVLYVRWFS
jgi:hypothetical protein